MTLTLMPVSFSNSGPVTSLSSRACRPASAVMVMVVPLNCLAAAIALSAAFSCANAGQAVATAMAAAASIDLKRIRPSLCDDGSLDRNDGRRPSELGPGAGGLIDGAP